MAKRKVRDDADITAAPTKKTKTSAKKGKKAADEDGMYIVVRLLAQCPSQPYRHVVLEMGRLDGDWSLDRGRALAPMARYSSHASHRILEHRCPTPIPDRSSTRCKAQSSPTLILNLISLPPFALHSHFVLPLILPRVKLLAPSTLLSPRSSTLSRAWALEKTATNARCLQPTQPSKRAPSASS
jgi:hypothetical protein